MRSNFQIYLARNLSNKQFNSVQALSPYTECNNHPHNNHPIHPQLIMFNPRLPEPFFVTRLPKGGVTTPSLDFRYWASDSYDFGTRG